MQRLILATIFAIGLIGTARADFLTDLFAPLTGQPAQVEQPAYSGRSVYHRHSHYAPVGGSPAVMSMVTNVAQQYGVSPALAHAIVRKESGYRCGVHGGIMQVNPRTARSMGVSGRGCYGGLVAGMMYLRQSIATHGWGCAAFSAYQSGIGVHRCSAYGRSIMAMMNGGSGVEHSYRHHGWHQSARHHRSYASHHHYRYASR